MLSCVLNSQRAIHVNIQIVRAFTKLQEMLTDHKELKKKVEEMEQKYDYQFKVVFDAIKKLLDPPEKSKGRIPPQTYIPAHITAYKFHKYFYNPVDKKLLPCYFYSACFPVYLRFLINN